MVTLYPQVVCSHAMDCKSLRGRRGRHTKTQISTVNMPLYSFTQSDKSGGEETLCHNIWAWRSDYTNLCIECKRRPPVHFCVIEQISERTRAARVTPSVYDENWETTSSVGVEIASLNRKHITDLFYLSNHLLSVILSNKFLLFSVYRIYTFSFKQNLMEIM